MSRVIAIFSVVLALLSGALLAEEAAGPLDVPPVPVLAVTFSPNGALLAIGFGGRDGPGGLLLWDLEKKAPLRALRRDRAVTSVSFSPDGALLAFTPRAMPAVITDVAGGGEVATLEASHRGPITFSKDGQTLATGSADKSIRLWDLKSRADKEVLKGPADLIYGKMAFSPEGDWLAAPCGSDGIYVWDLAQERLRHVLRHGNYFTRCVLFSPDRKWIVTGGWDGTTRVWNAASGELRAKIGGAGGVNCLDFEPRTRLLAVGAYGKAIRLHKFSFDPPDDAQGRQVRELLARLDDESYDVREAASAGLTNLGFVAELELRRESEQSPSPEVRIRTRRARQAILAGSGELLAGHQAQIWCLSFSPDGRLLASGSEDGTVRLWDVARRIELTHFVPASLEKN